ncbi:hypothetical protein ACJMK2_009865 [Sinanodonta woodiana]|uniref:T-cell activation inhibitor, mitochondrial n=1 Tax=Sinanodonta woodiana TaxID=1069815 RepID=A0ABD3VDK8_SINWO
MFRTCIFSLKIQKRQLFPLVFGRRSITANETAAVLRPFYFAVHPDRFGSHPNERSINEESLKSLHEYVDCLQKGNRVRPTEVVFFIQAFDGKGHFIGLRKVKITLASSDLRKTLTSILNSCELPLDYLQTISTQKTESVFGDRPVKWDPSYYAATGKTNSYQQGSYKPPPQKTLGGWLKENISRIRRYSETARFLQGEIDKICEKLVGLIGMTGIYWDNIWGNRHYMGCLKTFDRLCTQQTHRIQGILKGRAVVFSSKTGINLHGEIVLGSEDVPAEWMTLLLSVKAYDAVLERLPRMERELSCLLNGIKVVRGQRHHTMMAQQYEVLLNKILNSLRRCQEDVLREIGTEDLSHLELIAEGDSGPLALSSSGQLLIPASVPGSMAVKFIAENKVNAVIFLAKNEREMKEMDEILVQCKKAFDLSSLLRDETVTPQQMTECCKRLLDLQYSLGEYLQGTELRISMYYTVMKDGEVTIPWNWLDDS